MFHGDQVKSMPDGFKVLVKTIICPITAYANESLNLFGVQFHLEVIHTQKGITILKSFAPVIRERDEKN